MLAGLHLDRLRVEQTWSNGPFWRAGIPALGFAAAVDALRSHGERLLRLGEVEGTDGTYHFQLFLDDGLTAVVACLGVDRRLGYRVQVGDRVELACAVVGWVSDEWPGWIRVQVTDIRDRSWYFVDKLPIFGADADPGAALPAMAAIHCRVVGTVDGDDRPNRRSWLSLRRLTG